MQNHDQPNGRAYIIGERDALRQLGEALIKTSKSVVGLDIIDLYTSDGHKYELVITCDVDENEWQELPVPYHENHDPTVLSIVKTFIELSN